MSISVLPQFGRRANEAQPAIAVAAAAAADIAIDAGPSAQAINEIRSLCLSRLEPAAVAGMPAERLTGDVERLISEIATPNGASSSMRASNARSPTELVHDMLGLGPLEPLLDDETITDIMVNGPDRDLRRTPRQDGAVDRPVPRHAAPRQHLPAHRRRGRPADRRIEPDGGRPAEGRLARQHRVPAAGAGRPLHLDPQVRQASRSTSPS